MDDEDEQEATAEPEENASDEHRAAVGDALQQLSDQKGIDLSQLAGQLGLSADDVSKLSQGDLVAVAEHLAQEHPEIVRSVAARIPVVGGLIGRFFGGNQ